MAATWPAPLPRRRNARPDPTPSRCRSRRPTGGPSRTVRREAAVARDRPAGSPSGRPAAPAARGPRTRRPASRTRRSETDGVRSASTSNTSASTSTLTSRDEYTDSDAPADDHPHASHRGPRPGRTAPPLPVTQPGDTHSRNRRCGTQPTYGATTRQLDSCGRIVAERTPAHTWATSVSELARTPACRARPPGTRPTCRSSPPVIDSIDVRRRRAVLDASSTAAVGAARPESPRLADGGRRERCSPRRASAPGPPGSAGRR